MLAACKQTADRCCTSCSLEGFIGAKICVTSCMLIALHVSLAAGVMLDELMHVANKSAESCSMLASCSPSCTLSLCQGSCCCNKRRGTERLKGGSLPRLVQMRQITCASPHQMDESCFIIIWRNPGKMMLQMVWQGRCRCTYTSRARSRHSIVIAQAGFLI